MRTTTAAFVGFLALTVSSPAWPGQTETGEASFYGEGLQGEETASGEKFDASELTAAHPTHPPGTRLRVTNLENDRSVEVRVTDRGPSERNQRKGVVVDLSKRAAEKLGFKQDGKTDVKIEVLEAAKSTKR